MSDQEKVLALDGLAIESIEVVPADSLESAGYGHGITELGASCNCDCGPATCVSCHVAAGSAADLEDEASV